MRNIKNLQVKSVIIMFARILLKSYQIVNPRNFENECVLNLLTFVQHFIDFAAKIKSLHQCPFLCYYLKFCMEMNLESTAKLL